MVTEGLPFLCENERDSELHKNGKVLGIRWSFLLGYLRCPLHF